MDPVGPWSAYASYNRLAAGVQAAAGTTSAELHHHLTPPSSSSSSASTPATTTTQLLPGGFLSPTPVGYDTVFSPLFHPGSKSVAAAAAAAHYVNPHRAAAAAALASKQSGDGEYHQSPTQAFFEQGSAAWQQNSPFGILPHETVVATTSGKTVAAYENLNAHFAAQSLNHLNSQLAKSAAAANRVSAQASKATAFFQVPSTFVSGDNNTSVTVTTTKSFSAAPSNSSNLQQTCIVSSPSSVITKDYRVPQVPTRPYLSPNPQRNLKPPASTSAQPTQIQTKAQTKIYPELASQNEARQQRQSNDEPQTQASPISFSIMDVPGRLNYSGSNNSSVKRQFQQHSYRQQHYQQQNASNSSEQQDFQRPKSSSEYNNVNGPECTQVVVPRRPSPLQAHSQASPLGHAPSPAYPMYNSPMNSISSPQQPNNNQVAPPSPLDVSVPRPSAQQATATNVAYPSVITRALNNENKSFSDRYERQQAPQQQQQQTCWEDRQQQSRKFPNNAQTNYTSSQPYFDSNSGHHSQVTLQDLSSCRGDPMSIVKNLQQQSCQVLDIKEESSKISTKRRKSNEKPAAPTDGRIPPPAHSTTTPNQQQNGGAYFDFDRWNLPPPAAKIFSTHQQHQGLMVPHHPPPPLPYFAPFHLGPPPEFGSGVDLPVLNNYQDQSGSLQGQFHHHHHQHHNQQQQQHIQHHHHHQQQQQQQQQEEHVKVVVPNIEEELNFLSTGTSTITSPNNSINSNHSINNKSIVGPMVKPQEKPAGGGGGFMSSYLKFLQGERDSSPPPASRSSRKQNSWVRPQQVQQTQHQTHSQLLDEKIETNGIGMHHNVPLQQQQHHHHHQIHHPPVIMPHHPPSAPSTSFRSSQGDPQDDPRYFPLPKERKRNSFDSDSDGNNSDDDFFSNVKPFSYNKKDDRRHKLKKTLRNQNSDAKRKQKRLSNSGNNKIRVESIEVIPRRESVKRAAKEKTNSLQHLIKSGEDDLEEPIEFQDSETEDPAWTPQALNDDDQDAGNIFSKKMKKSAGSKKKRNLITAAAHGAGIHETDGYLSDGSKKNKGNKCKPNIPPTLEDNIAAAIPNTMAINDESPFKPGEFVVIRSELVQEWPAIWRIDGKSLLQKYEPFEQNGSTLYRNISTYTSWTPESKKQYISIPVQYKSQSQVETIVEFLRNEMTIIDTDYQQKCMKECEGYQDNFEVYIQTLISQALDSNFLMEIFHEKDEYFLTNVKTIDDITESKKKKLLTMLRWPSSLQAAVCTWPCYNIIKDLNPADTVSRCCAACGRSEVAVRVLMYGQPYNSTTLEGCQPDPKAMNEKNFLMCRICAMRVELANKVTHQKYLMYIECAKRVGEKRSSDSNKDTTCILNELLADENWLNQLFYDVRTSWAEIDCIERSH